MATSPLDVVVVGAGIGGLLAAIGLRLDGHGVVVVDQAAAFGEVGAGLRIPPNSFRLLHRWGVDLTYTKKTPSNGNRFLRWDTGAVLADLPHGVPELAYGGSYLMVHRADYHAALLARARALGAAVRPGQRVVGYDWAAPAVRLAGGETLGGDLVVVADGVQSAGRAAFAGPAAAPPTDTGDLSYRVLVPGHVLLADADPGVRALVSLPWVSSWCGPGAHVIGYPVRGGEVYNVVFCVAAATMPAAAAADAATAAKTVLKDNRALVARFAGWEPRVRRLAALAGAEDNNEAGVLQWRLFDLARADRWVHPGGGRAVLLGDAAHPMLPYMASGAAMACEDAAVLRGVLRAVTDKGPGQLAAALARYQALRQPRAAVLQRWGRRLQAAYHVADGPAQAARDAAMLADGAANPLFWGSAARRQWLFGHDAEDLAAAAAAVAADALVGIDTDEVDYAV